MRGLWAALAVLALISVPVGARAQFAPPSLTLTPDLEQCIRANAVRVEAAIPELDKAAEYLVANICAVPMAAGLALDAKTASDAQQARLKAACDKHKASAKPSDEDDSCDSLDFEGGSVFYTTGFSSLYMAPPAAKALAASLLLDLRLSHLKTVWSH